MTGYVLRICAAAALIIDAVVHLKDARFYDASTQALLSQGQLFRIQAGVAIVVAAAVLIWPRRLVWLIAFLVAASAVGAVVLYTYVNVGSLAGLPDMYEPSWGPPGKALSAIAEGTGALFALAWPGRFGADAGADARHRPAGSTPRPHLDSGRGL